MDQLEMFEATKDGCTFCKIIRGEITARVVYEDETTMAFLDHRPLLPGHCLLVPKSHHETLTDLPFQLVQPFFVAAQRLTLAVQTGLEAEGSFVAVNNRISQSVPHLHAHIVPRRKKDGLFTNGFVWKRQPYKDDASAETVRLAIISALQEQSTLTS